MKIFNNIFLRKKILIYGLGKSGISSYKFLKNKSDVYLFDDNQKIKFKLKKKIIKFREDELHHKDIAYNKGATKKGLYSIMDKIIKTGSKVAINISEKI